MNENKKKIFFYSNKITDIVAQHTNMYKIPSKYTQYRNFRTIPSEKKLKVWHTLELHIHSNLNYPFVRVTLNTFSIFLLLVHSPFLSMFHIQTQGPVPDSFPIYFIQ